MTPPTGVTSTACWIGRQGWVSDPFEASEPVVATQRYGTAVTVDVVPSTAPVAAGVAAGPAATGAPGGSSRAAAADGAGVPGAAAVVAGADRWRSPIEPATATATKREIAAAARMRRRIGR